MSATPTIATVSNAAAVEPRSISLPLRALSELLATAFLVAAVVGSGIMGERLAGGNVGIALLANSIATGAALVALILSFGPISGAHMNPAVTMAAVVEGVTSWREASVYATAQIVGGAMGTLVAHLMFGLPLVTLSHHARNGPAQVFSEFVATFGLLWVILSCVEHEPRSVPYAVAAYITAAYWFTASTSFANPAVTIARAFTNTFAGIRPFDVPPFVIAEMAAAAAATFLFRAFRRPRAPRDLL